MNGAEIAHDLPVDENWILDEDPFGNERAPDEESYEGYQRNYGAEATHWYRNTVSLPQPLGDLIAY